MVKITEQELRFIEDLGLLIEISNGSKTLGRVFGYLLLADRPKTLDDIATTLLFSKATASLTVRQGLVIGLYEKVSIPGERRTYYRANMQSWINTMSKKVNALREWEKLLDLGLSIIHTNNTSARENLTELKNYFVFLNWYLADLADAYERWKNGEINLSTSNKIDRNADHD